MDKTIYQACNIKRIRFKNRVMMGEIQTRFAKGGFPEDQLVEFYRKRAKGGAGAVVVKARVDDVPNAEHILSAGNDSSINGLMNLANQIHKYDAKLIIKLFFYEKAVYPVMRYAQAAVRCMKAGADAVLLHLENEEQFEILYAVKKELEEEDSLIVEVGERELLEKLLNSGLADSILINIEHKNILKNILIKIPIIMAVETEDELSQVFNIHDAVCFVSTVKPFIVDPGFAQKFMEGKPFIPCHRGDTCRKEERQGQPISCTYNPEVGYEYIENTHRKIATVKKILVVGGGMAGMYAAKKAAERGYKTTICTAGDMFGGKFVTAADDRQKEYVKILEGELKNNGVELIRNTMVDKEYILRFAPYFLVLATGSKVSEELTDAMENARISYSKIGNARAEGSVKEALEHAFELFLRVYIA